MVYGQPKIRKRFLPERSFLYFVYPEEQQNKVEFYLPMLENMEVSESQKPNYVTYDLMGRSGNLFAYTGSKSREISVRFNITLPNIIDYVTNLGFSPSFRKVIDSFYKSEEKNRFKRPPDLAKEKIDHFDLAFNYFKSLDQQTNALESVVNLGLAEFLEKEVTRYSTVAPKYLKDSVNYLILWVNVLRTSVVNNATRTNLGPPTIYLNHGTMYNNIPCICTNVSIKLNTPVGYDLLSLTPKQVAVDLTLVENRVGDFRNFIPFKTIEGNNLAGWEAVLQYGTMDPYNLR